MTTIQLGSYSMNSEEMKYFFFKPRARKGLPFSSLVLNTIPEFLLRANKQENRRQLNQNLSGDEMCI